MSESLSQRRILGQKTTEADVLPNRNGQAASSVASKPSPHESVPHSQSRHAKRESEDRSDHMEEPKSSVALIGNFLSSLGGSRCVCEELTLRLMAAGWSVITASNKKARTMRLFDMVWTVFSCRHRYEAALVEVYSGRSFVWAEVVCAVLRQIHKPYVLALHGGNLPRFARQHPARVGRLLASAAAVTVPSPYLLEQMAPYRPGLQLVPNALDLSRYSFRLRDTAQPLMVWLRSFHDLYNPVMAVNVLAQLVPKFPAARLTMVGPDKKDGSFQRTEQAARDLGVLAQLSLPGGVPKTEVPAWLEQGDIFLNTTNADNTPVSVLEAMACGLCVVSTNVGGLPYLLQHEQDALLVPANDAHAMAAAVRRLMTEPGLAERLSRSGRAKAEQCDWAAVLPQWEALLHAAAAKPRGEATPALVNS